MQKKTSAKALKKFERKIVNQMVKQTSEPEFNELERKVLESKEESEEGLGIEEEEDVGEEAYPEIEEAEKDEEE